MRLKQRLCRFVLALGVALALAAPAHADETVRVAILPIVVHTLDEQQDYLREGLADMLAARLGRSPGVAVVRVADPAKSTTDAATALATAQELGADYALFGSFTRFGQGASLDVKCLPVAGSVEEDPRAVFIQAGSLGEIIPRLDDLAERVVVYLQQGDDAPLPSVASPPAARPTPAAVVPSVGEAFSEIEDLRIRVEQLEEALYEARQADGRVAGIPEGADGAPDGEQSSELR